VRCQLNDEIDNIDTKDTEKDNISDTEYITNMITKNLVDMTLTKKKKTVNLRISWIISLYLSKPLLLTPFLIRKAKKH